ncbi:MAG: CoA ester lyase [Gammaproteobacteria bacterium]|nr:CoA ester lyase [Gammaproteobacteria bacterium]MDH3410994.1 CoA ester lyase [Gammaproteobacteria bacterium]
MSANSSPVWRSLLYVPANNQRFIDKAHTRDADGLILDLEDSVPPGERHAARAGLKDSVQSVGSGHSDVLVRVNAGPPDADADLDAAVIPGVTALVVPKTESPGQIAAISKKVAALESARGLEAGGIRFLVLIESPEGLLNARDVARADPRVVALTLGSEDFAAETGMQPNEDNLLLPKQMTLFAARAARVMPLGLVGSIVAYQDIEALERIALRSRALGFEGASCIHPSAVPVLNDAFTPSHFDVDKSKRIVSASEQAAAEGRGAFELDGRMVDAPVVTRAKRLLQRAEAIALRLNRSA